MLIAFNLQGKDQLVYILDLKICYLNFHCKGNFPCLFIIIIYICPGAKINCTNQIEPALFYCLVQSDCTHLRIKSEEK